MSVPLLSLVGWSIVPDFATKQILSLLYRFFPHYIVPPPQGSLVHRRHYAITFALVVLSYLSYNLLSSARDMPPNFYQILDVPSTVDDSGLKVAFRQFARRYHPDRPGVGRDGEEMFMKMRDVYEALKDPVVRFAYDRFGPDVLSWTQCSTTREYIHHGLLRSSGYHIVIGAGLLFWSFIGSNSVSFWRYTLYFAILAGELSLILSPSPASVPSFAPLSSPFSVAYTSSTPLHAFFPSRLPYQHILFLHQLFLFLSISLSRVVPVLIASFLPHSQSASLASPDQHALLERILAVANIADREASIMLHTAWHSIGSPSEAHENIASLVRSRPFHAWLVGGGAKEADASGDPGVLRVLKKEIEELIIESNVKKEDGPLRSVWEAAVKRGRDREAEKETTMRTATKGNFWEVDSAQDDVAASDVGVDPGLPSPCPSPSPQVSSSKLATIDDGATRDL